MLVPAVVEAGSADEVIFYFAPDAGNAADQFFVFVRADGHEVGDLPYSIGGKKAGEQDVGIGEVELFLLHLAKNGPDVEEAAIFFVQEFCEDGGGVEIGKTQKVDGTVEADESDSVEVADDAIIFDGLITQV